MSSIEKIHLREEIDSFCREIESNLQKKQTDKVINIYEKTIAGAEAPYSKEEIDRYCREIKPKIPIEITNKIYKSYYKSVIIDEIQKLINKAKELAEKIKEPGFKAILFARISAEEASLNPKAAESTLQFYIPGFIPAVLSGVLPDKLNNDDVPNREVLLDYIFSFSGDMKEAFNIKKERDLSLKELCHVGIAKYYFDPEGAFEILIKLEDKIKEEADEELLYQWFMHLTLSLITIDLRAETQVTLNKLEKIIDLICDTDLVQDDEKWTSMASSFYALKSKYHYSLTTKTEKKLEEVVASVDKLLTNPDKQLADATIIYCLEIVERIRALKLLV